MKLTTRGRYAVTAMLDLALYYQNTPVSLAEMAERQDISLAYLEQLFAKLRKSGLVASTRGPGGGYTLNRPLDQISVCQVIEAVDEPVDSTRCGGTANCHRNQRCLTHDLWTDLNLHIEQFLKGVSLADLVTRHRQSVCARSNPVMISFDLTPAG